MNEEQGTFQTSNGDYRIGQALEKARKEQGLTLEAIEQATKIRKYYLSCLEREDYGALPDAVYARGFLKTYANYLGLDGEEFSRALKDQRRLRRERAEPSVAPQESSFEQPLVNPAGLTGRRRILARTALTVLVALLAVFAVVGALYFVGSSVQTSGSGPPPSGGEQKRAGGDSKPQPDSAQKKNAGEESERAGGAQAAREESTSAAPETLVVRVTVKDAPSWLSILTDGALAYEQIAQPGFSQTFEAKHRVRITTGNAGAVDVEVNGQSLGRLGASGEVLTRNFTLKSAS
jgi:cytoskeleton protein RodZ